MRLGGTSDDCGLMENMTGEMKWQAEYISVD